MWWRSLSPRHAKGRPPPPPKPMTCLSDVASRLLCGQRVLRRWAEDTYLEQEEFKAMWTPFKGFILHLFILLGMNATCLCRLDRFMFFTQDALQDFYCNNHFSDGAVDQITFSEVDSVERVWSFLAYLVEAAGEDDAPQLTVGNPIVGRIRLRQVRVRPGPCIAAQWAGVEGYDKCYDFFDEDSEDRAPFGLGDGGGEAWAYRDDPGGDTSYGYLYAYPSSGYWVDLPRDGEEAKQVVDALQNNSWIDVATRGVFLEHATYNANCNELCHVGVRFELPPGGGVVPFIMIRCGPLMQSATWSDAVRLALEILFAACTALLTLGELWMFLRHCGAPLRFLANEYSVWTLMNELMLAMCWATLWFGAHRYEETSRLLLALQAEGLAATHRVHAFFFYQIGHLQILAGAVFVAWLRTFQYHRVTTQVLVTLQRSRFDLFSYFGMYVVLHCAFAQAGYYLFGDQVSPFKTFSESALAILAIALGEMRSDVILTTHGSTGPVYFILLIFIVIFVFHNMFFVILSYNYDSVREERSQLDRGLNFGAFIHNGYLNLTKVFTCLPAGSCEPPVDMERRLMRCGFSPGSLQTFKAFLQPAQGAKTPMQTPQPAVVSVKELNVVEEIITVMEKELAQAKSELTSLVSSLSGDLYGM